MSKAAAVLFFICTFACGNAAATINVKSEAVFHRQEQSQQSELEYAQWSRVAFKEAGNVYTLLNYLYLGRSNVAPGVAQQQFRFWAKKNDDEFPLIVSIRYDPVTQKMFTISMEEEKRGNLQLL
ncbi:DUF3889 domain-containing protein [Paenibacillus sp. SYP-B3998]|uniref:DUF3889 domain-containing protein n=1 Tax=Paenibacillus sp. SYP-B3998 TaxID=2678564 RepID=A0A6G3ZR87_9BACL|nr:DUF3889 domain-containing protein [Paenibacillus sp. SYP-B3998]NEW04548.1 DUF3889 domain-containing protein [Paenibacillus sp. SYP-B3998]